MSKIAFICGEPSIDITGWHHYGFWYRALQKRAEVQWFSWPQLDTIPAGFDLYFFLDFRYELFKLPDYYKLQPRILYWWDSFHHLFSLVSQTPLIFDKVYFAEYLCTQHTRMLGFNNVEWLPASYCPDLYQPLKIPQQYDLSFVGQFDDNVVRSGLTRKRMLDSLTKYKSYISNNTHGPHLNQIYNESKIKIERTIHANIGTRLFEVIGSGGFCLMNKFPCENGLDRIGIDGIHFVTYNETLEDLINKIDYYLAHDQERETIAWAGWEHFRNHHTYDHRLDKIIKDFL